jgi:cytochrome c-type biogenesis protein
MTGSVGVLIALGAGLFSFLSPCVLPIVPSYLSFVTGMSLEDLHEGADRGRTLTYATLFIAGFSLIFVLLGASASFLGQFFRVYEVWIARIGGGVIILLGLHLAGLFRITPLLREVRVQVSERPVGYLGALGVGMAFGAGWTPCIGPQLGAIMTFAATRETFWEGVGLLGVYSLGLAVPFLLTALAVDRFLVLFHRMRRYLPALQRASGILLVLLGILLLTGTFTALTTWLVPFTPDFILERI